MLKQKLAENILLASLETGGDFAEIFVEDKVSTSLSMIGGRVERAVSGRDFGIGIRILKGQFSIYAFTNDFAEENLIRVARSAAQAIKGKSMGLTLDLRKSIIDNRNQVMIMPNTISKRKKVEWMRRGHQAAKAYDSVISQVSISYSGSMQKVLIANTEGLFVEDLRSRNVMSIGSVAENNEDKESASIMSGCHSGLEHMENLDIESIGKEASRSAKTKLFASLAPSGNFQVVIENEFGGVIFHEACGHGLEADAVSRNASVFADKIGEYVASPLVTAYDDGAIPNAWGSLNIDDEGTPTKKNLLIEDGILKGYLIDKLGGRKLNMESTGSGRRKSYKIAPSPRMNNTYIAAGKSTPEEIIANTELGVYAKYMDGGSVNPATSDFNFAISEGYMIRNGKIAEPIKGATLIGKGIDTLKKIDMVGNNLGLGMGTCGGASGSIPVTVGQPMIRVSELTVGGRGGE